MPSDAPKIGRPRIEITPEQMGMVEGLSAVLNAQQIADYFGMARSTFFERLADTPELEEKHRAGKAKAVATIGNRLIRKALDGDTTAMIFIMKCKGEWRETSKIEVSGPDGGAIPVAAQPAIDLGDLSQDERDQLRAMIANRRAEDSDADLP